MGRRDVTSDDFDKLLTWLHPDRELAGKKYEDIRRRLTDIFAWRGCTIPEDLADETINRVSLRVHEVADTYVGDPARFFHGVAKKVLLEHIRKPYPQYVPIPDQPDEDRHECLDMCIGRLTPENQEIILGYYQEDRRVKIDLRKELADRFGMTPEGLRVRVCRIRATLKKCVFDCVGRREPFEDV